MKYVDIFQYWPNYANGKQCDSPKNPHKSTQCGVLYGRPKITVMCNALDVLWWILSWIVGNNYVNMMISTCLWHYTAVTVQLTWYCKCLIMTVEDISIIMIWHRPLIAICLVFTASALYWLRIPLQPARKIGFVNHCIFIKSNMSIMLSVH